MGLGLQTTGSRRYCLAIAYDMFADRHRGCGSGIEDRQEYFAGMLFSDHGLSFRTSRRTLCIGALMFLAITRTEPTAGLHLTIFILVCAGGGAERAAANRHLPRTRV